jgi:hypothetical protein
MIAALGRELLDVWETLQPERRRPRRLHVVKLSQGDYPPPAAPLLFLLFADGATRPAAVAKAARMPAGDGFIEDEIDALELVQSLLPAELSRDVPRLVRHGSVNERRYLLMTALPGEVELHNTWGAAAAQRRGRRIAAALQWIRHAGAAARGGTRPGGEWFGMPVDAALASLVRLGLDRTRLRRHETRLATLWTATWPCGLSHGDYFPGNVLFGRGDRLGVVDWLQAEKCAPRFCDPLTYELSFHAACLHAGRSLVRDEVEAVHELPAFAAERRHWGELGTDLGLAGAPRLATLLHAALRDGAPESSRGPIGVTWARLLEWHLENFAV